MAASPGGAATCSSRGIRSCMAILVLIWAASTSDVEGGGSFEMQLVYRYSEQFRELTKGRPRWEHVASQEWPRKDTPEFYHALAVNDGHRHAASRNLLTNDVYSLAPNATTYYLPPMGAIHYGFIRLGTPPKTFLVGLDTGSDLLWVPCDCQQCSIANWAAYGINLRGIEFGIYSPSNSSTSKVIACNSEICKSTLSPSACDVSAPQTCTYEVNYLSANTSSSGKIVQDVVYLFQENKIGPEVTSNIYFGCGTTQTGIFLDGAAPDGLFGLGPEVYSVPVTLGKSGVIQNVFSMCFKDSLGKLIFGRKPPDSLQRTPLIPTNPNVFYVVGLEGIVAGGVSVALRGRVLFDTGTSLTSLPSNVIKAVGDAISSTTTLKPWTLRHRSSSLQFDYCWNATTNAQLDSLSSLSFVFGGGGTWKVIDPLLAFGENGFVQFFCLGIVAREVPIIGYNFMKGYEYFFDLDNSTFSWSPSDCSTAPVNSTPSSSQPPPPTSSEPSISSPPIAQAEPPLMSPFIDIPPVDIPQAPPSNGSDLSKAYRKHTPFHVLYLTILTALFHVVANKMGSGTWITPTTMTISP